MKFGKKDVELINETTEVEKEYKDDVSSLMNGVSND